VGGVGIPAVTHATDGSPSLAIACPEKQHAIITAIAMQVLADFIWDVDVELRIAE
jgi:hypothetical protein